MNNCEWKDKIYALHDGELSPAETLQAKAHLDACEECVGDLASWTSVSNIFFKPAQTPDTGAFVTRVMANLDDAAPARGEVRWDLWWKAPALALSLATFVLIGTMPRTLDTLPVQTLLVSNGSDPITSILGGSDTWDDDILSFALERPS